MQNPAKNKKHWLVLAIACCMCSASIGLILNTIGLFYIPVSSDLGILVGEFAIHATLNSLFMAVTSLFFPVIAEKFGSKPTMTAGVMLAFVGTAGMGMTDKIWVFNILGIIRGTGAGLFARVPMTILINNWFEEKNGFALSIANSFAGIAGALFAPIITWLIQAQGWELAFFWKGIFILLFSIPVIFLPYSFEPENEGYLPYGYGRKYVDSNTEQNKKLAKPNKFSYISITFFSLAIFSFLQALILGLATHMTAIGESFGLTAQLAGLMMSSLMIGNIVFKLIFGSLSDAIGVVKTTVLTILINIIGTVLLLASPNPLLLVIASFLYGSAYAVGSIAFPVLLKEKYGRAISNRVFPILDFIINIGKALAITAVGFLFDFTGSYLSVLLLAVLFNLIDLGAIYIIFKNDETSVA